MFRIFLHLFSLIFFLSAPAKAQDYLSFSLGYFDILDDHDALDIRAEYRPNQDLLIENLKPWIGFETSSDINLWIGGGLLYDFNVADNFYLTPSIGAGYYARGKNGKDLGYPLEFRSQLELSYEFEDKDKIGLSLSHTSNASIDSQNPGMEVLSFYYHIPCTLF